MNEEDYDINVFAFTDKNELWDAIMLILERNAELEVANAISGDVTGEKRIHACGRAEISKDLVVWFKTERQRALELKKSEFI